MLKIATPLTIHIVVEALQRAYRLSQLSTRLLSTPSEILLSPIRKTTFIKIVTSLLHAYTSSTSFVFFILNMKFALHE